MTQPTRHDELWHRHQHRPDADQSRPGKEHQLRQEVKVFQMPPIANDIIRTFVETQQILSSKIMSTGSETKCDWDGGWSCRWLFCHCLCLCHCHCLCLCLAGGFRHCLCLFLCHCHSLGFSVIDHQKYFQKVETLSEALQLTQMMIISSMAYKNFSGIPAGTPFFWLESWLAKLTWGGKGGDRTY